MRTREEERRHRLHRIVVTLTQSDRKVFPLSKFIGQICFETGCTMKTARSYFQILEAAGMVKVDPDADTVKFTGEGVMDFQTDEDATPFGIG